MPRPTPPRWRSLFCAAVFLAPMLAHADDPSAPPGALRPPTPEAALELDRALNELDKAPGTVVADVGTHTVTWGEIADAVRALPPIMAALPLQQLMRNVTAQLVEEKALAERGAQANLAKDPAVQRQMRVAADHALAEAFVRRSLSPNLTDKALRPFYDSFVAGKPGPDEVRARVIAVDSNDEAVALIHRIHNGEDFSAVARSSSLDGTAPNGGDLGFVRQDMMEPVLGAVMFAMEVGQISAYPIRSGAHWFIIKVDSRRQTPPPTFEEVRSLLVQDIEHIGVAEVRRQALKAVPVKYYGAGGALLAPASN